MIVPNSRAAIARMARAMATKSNIASSPSLFAATGRDFVTATNVVFEKHITKVPTMGDSITEVREEVLSRTATTE